jgi:hypothetical protein
VITKPFRAVAWLNWPLTKTFLAQGTQTSSAPRAMGVDNKPVRMTGE